MDKAPVANAQRWSTAIDAYHRSSASNLLSATLALGGCIVSVYLAFYQFGDVSHVWEPFFGNGSAVILNAGLLDSLSRMLGFRVHDASVGAIGYGLEAGLAVATLGSRTTWLSVAYCGLVLSMGLTSLMLIVLQAAVFHAWCTLCLISAAVSQAIVVSSIHDIADSADFLIHGRCRS